MTDTPTDTAPEAITQAFEAESGHAWEYSGATQVVSFLGFERAVRRLNSHSAGEGLREALRLCADFIRMFRDNGVAQLGEGVHAGLRKGSDASDSGELWSAIANSRTSAWSDAVAWAHDPFFSMWGGNEALAAADAALPTPPSDAGSTTRSGGEGGALSLDDYAYDELWGAIAAATRIEAGIVAISVVKFREAIRAIATTQADNRNEAFTITLPSDMGSAEVQDQGDGKFAVWVRSAEGDYKSAWNLPSFEVAVRNIMGVLWNGCLPFATTPSPDASPDSGEIEADRDYLHDLITKVGVYSEQEDKCLPLRIVDESDPSTGHVGEVRLYLPAGYQIVRTAR